jgi:hypothetical protein
MSYQLTGKIKSIGAVEQKSDTFRMRMFVVTVDADTNYPQHIQLQATNDKCDLLNSFAAGSDVTVAFNLRGREWVNPADNTTKYFNTLDAWRIEAATAGAPQANPGVPAQNAIPANQVPVSIGNQGGDDLPF